MFKWLGICVCTLCAALRTRRDLVIENLTLRQQLAVLTEKQPRPRLTDADRFFWIVLSQVWVRREDTAKC